MTDDKNQETIDPFTGRQYKKITNLWGENIMYQTVMITQRQRTIVSYSIDLITLAGERKRLAIAWNMINARIIARGLATEHYARLKIRPENIRYTT